MANESERVPLDRCGNCRFFHVHNEDDKPTELGDCRRYPPVLPNFKEQVDEIRQVTGGIRPVVWDGDWCGEWQPLRSPNPDNHPMLSKPITALHFSKRVMSAFYRGSITDVKQLVNTSADELLELREFGATSLNEVRRKLEEHGLHLKGE